MRYSVRGYGDGRTASELLSAGAYDAVHPTVNALVESDGVAVSNSKDPVDLELISHEEKLGYDGMLREIKSRGLILPTAEDALRFGIQYPDVQRKVIIVFPHLPVCMVGGWHHLYLGSWKADSRGIRMRPIQDRIIFEHMNFIARVPSPA